MKLDLLLRSGTLVHPGLGNLPGSVGVAGGRIVALLPADTDAVASETVDCTGKWIMPGIIDPHVHFGFGSPDTDFATEARSAALGGITSALSFYRTADFRSAFDAYRDQRVAQSCIDMGLHFGITSHLHVETCPHYLLLDDHAPAGVLAKVNPPVRPRADVEAMWEGIADGAIDTVGTDHVPRKRSTKEGKGIWASSNGFPGVATMLPILLDEGVRRRGIAVERIAQVASANAARIYRMRGKGALAVGYDADLVIVDPLLTRTIDPAALESFADYSPYEGMAFTGWPVATYVRGRCVMRDGRVSAGAREHPAGRYLFRQ